MTKSSAEKSDDTGNRGEGGVVQPPPERIYDLTTTDKTELPKTAGPRERGEE